MASFKIGASRPLKTFQKMLHGHPVPGNSVGPALHVDPSILAETSSSSPCLASRMPPCQGEPGLRHSSGPLERPSVDGMGRALVYHIQKLGGLNRRFHVVGECCAMVTGFGPLVEKKGCLHINCLEMLAVCLGLCTFLPDLRGHHILIHSDSMTVVSYMNRQGILSSKCLFILTERLLKWAQLNLRSLKAMHVPDRLNQGADMLSCSNIPSDEWTVHPQTVQEIFSRAEVYLFASDDNSYCQTYFSKEPRPLRFSPDHSDPTGNQANQGTEAQSSVIFPALKEPALVRRAVSAALCTPLAHPPETGSPLSGEQNNLAPPVRAMGTTSLAS